MKKVYLVFIYLLITSFATMAQGTWNEPFRGEEHTYTATVTDGGTLATRWYVATDVNGTKATHGTDYTITAASGALSVDHWAGTGVYSVDITWGAAISVGATYYVFLEVDDAVSGCTNRMASLITIASDFNVLAYNVTGSADPFTAGQGDGDIKALDCPDDIVNPVWDGDSHTNIGTTEVVFKVERQFSLLGWQFEYSINNNGAALSGISNVRIVNASNTELYNGTNSTDVISVAAAQDFALVYVTMNNLQGATINIDFDIIIANNLTKDTDNYLDTSADNTTYTIRPIPVITNFGGI